MLLYQLVELGDEVAVEELCAEELLRAGLKDFPSVEGHEVATVVSDLQGFSQGSEGWGGATRGEDDTGIVVALGAQECRADSIGQDVLLSDERTVNI